MTSKPMIDKCQKLNMSTSSVFVLFIPNNTKLTITKIIRKKSVYAEPQVIVASGAQPTSVMFSSIPVDLTKSCRAGRSEEHTSELQSRFDLVCRLLLEKKSSFTNRPYTTWRRHFYWTFCPACLCSPRWSERLCF